jgi:hypothetical protein
LPGDELEYELPNPVYSWAPALDLPTIIPVATEGGDALPPLTAVDAMGALSLKKERGLLPPALPPMTESWNESGRRVPSSDTASGGSASIL